MTSLSNSSLWEKMQAYYNHMGPEAWEDEVVPLQITSNKYLATLYTKLIIAQINDFCASNDNSANEPFYILEIGAGHGKFSFYLLKTLAKHLKTFDLPMNSIKYVITDISQKNVDSCRNHPAMREFVDAGVLDFAIFNAVDDKEINLQVSKERLAKGTLSKPLFTICNYIFDTLPHDAFQVQDNKLYETELLIDDSKSLDVSQYFANTKFKFKQNLASSNYYNKEALDKILAYYLKTFDKSSFLIPLGGINCIDNLREFTTSHLVNLVADKGISHTELFDEIEDPDITLHGSVSLLVNFDAVGRYIENINGESMLMSNTAADFQVGCFIVNSSFKTNHTKFAFNSSLEHFSPQDLFNLCYHDDEVSENFRGLDELLALLNLAEWDPNIFYDYYPALLEYVEDDDNQTTHEQDICIINGVDAVWNYFFKLEKTQDIPFALAAILYNLDHTEKAINFYKLSLEQFGMQAETLYNLALSYQMIDDHVNAKKTAEQTLQIEPDNQDAKKLLAELRTVNFAEV